MAAIAADASYPYDGQDAAEDQWRDVFGSWLTDGVVAAPSGSNLRGFGDSTGRVSKIDPGAVRIQGTHGRWLAGKTLAHSANSSGNPRIDRVVARLRKTDPEGIELDVLTGTPASSPSAPAVTQNSTVWEIPLYRVGPLSSGYPTIPLAAVHRERRIWNSDTIAVYDDDDALNLWVPSPIAGAQASLLSTGGFYVHDGVDWIQQHRALFHVEYDPTGNDDTTGTAATWPDGLTEDIHVPAWATRLRARAVITRVAQSALIDADIHVQLLIGSTVIKDVPHVGIQAGESARDILAFGEIDVTAMADTDQTIRVAANSYGGSGFMRADAETTTYLEGEFR